MQEVNIRKENCRRFSAQIGQRMNCTQKVQRVRCCGRVINEQDADNKRTLDNRGKCMKNGQAKRMGQGPGKRNGNGKRTT